MIGKTVVVTGASGGIGLATAARLAGLGARVGLVGRSRDRTETAAADIRRRHHGAVVDTHVADLSVQAEVRRLARDLLAAYPRLDVLVNNVGGFWSHRHLTADGLERTLAVNHLAPFLLTNLLLDRLNSSGPARIVTVSSGAHSLGRIDFEDLQGERTYSGAQAYNQSKLANLLFTYELTRRLDRRQVTANALHPGMVRTSFGAEDQQPLWKLVAPLARPFMKSTSRGAALPVYLASSPDVQDVSGAYFASPAPRRSSASSYDEPAAAELWRLSADLVHLGPALA